MLLYIFEYQIKTTDIMNTIDRIIVKNTKVQIIIEQEIKPNNPKDVFNRLIVASLIVGASGNCLKQISRANVSDDEFEAIKNAQNKFNEIVYELENSLKLVLDNSKVDTHKFY